ncbi:prenyltransferase/squalene oxidase repeat-containing protein [Rubellicoccus peritrichatus]|uniref:Prenyltransferase/squalene oxidase repeat-containing protein n=1 Tax=Rubellicoccus peritrichatus TaxID=3080537 RepID=A0AAQ3LDC1_9BACT|nr:prenyltransferase/squalene oxidase repeat-containing protein [Puniceicoccus sp. CR14]WOO41488.1 prenyltransferase/squalene oxidase repeat-containing protein [Puniceicoccus sp. CR14]
MNASFFHRITSISLLLFLSSSLQTNGENNSPEKSKPVDISLRNEVENAIHQSLTVLSKSQQFDGYWSTSDYPGLTALILKAYLKTPVDSEKWANSETVADSVAFILSTVQEDGGIYSRGLQSYNTAISLMALNAYNTPLTSEKPKIDDVDMDAIISKARAFLVDQQQIFESGDNLPYSGGIGYGNSYKHSDLSNTSLAIQALKETRKIVESDQMDADLDWEAAIKFVENTQNLPEVNHQPWASDDPANRGGFVYFPGDSKAGAMKLKSGRTALRSYGSMSYAGLMSFLYAGLEPDDERVVAAVDWLQKNYTLDENPGMGQEGLYYYYYTMAKALDAYGSDTLVLEDGTEIDWRKNLAKRLISLQKHPGYWVNENGRWMESDPNIVTAYSLLALEILYPGL